MIEGATGPISGMVNGSFEVAERPDNEPPIYWQADGWDGWLYVSSTGRWAVGSKKNKDRRKTTRSQQFAPESRRASPSGQHALT